jgi:hypothetical protein
VKSKAIDRLREQLEEVGATLDASDFTLCCDAPSGYVWRATYTRCLPIPYASSHGRHYQSWLIKALKEERPSLAKGLVKVTDLEEIAMHRHDTGEDDWGAPADAPDYIELNFRKPKTQKA